MKKIIILSLVFIVGLISCKDLDDLNKDHKKPTEVPPEYLFTYGLENIARQMANGSYNYNVDRFWANYLTQTTYIQECNYDPINRDIGGTIWAVMYANSLIELKAAKEIIDEQPASGVLAIQKKNKMAQISILEVYAYQYLVDNFGNVPFSEALDPGNTTPAYDDAATIYATITANLIDALNSMDTSEDGFDGVNDRLYNGDISKWKKFGASLLLQLGMRIAEYNPSDASSHVSAAVNFGVFDSNDDNASFGFLSTDPYTSPVYDYFVTQSRASDFIATSFFVNMLEDYNDPRIVKYYDDNLGADTYLGGLYGASGNNYNNFSHVSTDIYEDPTYPSILLDYSTVCFFMAEAIERGFTGGDAEAEYLAGIKASFDFWGIPDADYDTYVAQGDVAYSSANYIDKIGMQKYLALYNQGHQAWTEARRLGVPTLQVADETGTPNPNRMLYPNDEDLLNEVNYDAAAAAMGGDLLSTHIFWDVN